MILDRFHAFRARLARSYVRQRLRCRELTVISDDCWGGHVYSELRIACHSPFISTGIAADDYLNFICRFREPGALDVLGVSTHAEGYPLLHTRHAIIHGMHHNSTKALRDAYERRLPSILWDRIFIKIDFGKFKYRDDHIARWNALKLPNSLAIYPDKPRFRKLSIHNGVALPDWVLDGHQQFNLSCRRFDLIDWINHGVVHRPFGSRCLHQLLVEHFPCRRAYESCRRRLGLST